MDSALTRAEREADAAACVEGAVAAARVERAVAAAVADRLARAGGTVVPAAELLADPELMHREFAALGLDSVDWMSVATELEDLMGLELPDELLLDADRRSIAGWAHMILALGRETTGDGR